MYYIFYQEYDDMKWYCSTHMKAINDFMKKENIAKELVILIKGEVLSDLFSTDWPKN